MIFDLHTHTTASDGALSPAELISLARDNGVGCLAITDHDTIAAYEQIESSQLLDLRLIVGIELSTSWQKHGIHIVGLNLDRDNSELRAGIAIQQDARVSRAQEIARRLVKTGIDDPFLAVQELAGDSMIGRPHFAQHLVKIGHVKDIRTAFRRYLGNGKTGDVKQCWSDLPEVIHWIRAAGGTAVLAHPAKYGMTWTKLRALVADFATSGGQAIEVVCGNQESNVTKKLVDICNDFELAASCGSDFHQVNSWSTPGKFAQLPDTVGKVWDSWSM